MSKYLLMGVVVQIFFLGLLLSNPILAQRQSIREIRITLEAEGNILDIFQDIEQVTEFKFSYIEAQLDLEKKLSIQANDETLKQVLERISRASQLKFKRINESIHVTQLKNSKERVIELIGSRQDIPVGNKLTIQITDTNFMLNLLCQIYK